VNRTVAVLGPGAVGGGLAVRLLLGGVRTICIAPPETTGLIALAGLTLETDGKILTARPEVRERLEAPVGLLLVTVKAPALEAALDRIEPASVANGVVMPLMNGLEHMEVLRARLGPRLAAGSVSHYQAYRPGRVQIIETTPAPLITVASDDLTRAELESATGLLQLARIDVRIATSEKRVLWRKVTRIAPLAAATSATGRPVGALRSDPEWRRRLEDAVGEACAVAAADGVSLNASEQWAIIDTLPSDLTPSAARDIAAGRRSELDAIVGAVLRAGDRLGVPCPILTQLARSAGWP
jgi:2-dehydropantoate 2-reductase